MNSRDFEQKDSSSEIQGFKSQIAEKEIKAKHLQYEARVMAEAMSTVEETVNGIQRQARDEQQQLKEASLALTEANRVLNRESLLNTSAFDGRGVAGTREKIQELEEN